MLVRPRAKSKREAKRKGSRFRRLNERLIKRFPPGSPEVDLVKTLISLIRVVNASAVKRWGVPLPACTPATPFVYAGYFSDTGNTDLWNTDQSLIIII